MSFIFIANTNTSLTAGDANSLDSISLGGVFKEQERRTSFSIGNTGSTNQIYYLSASGQNAGILDDVEFSQDQVNWAPTVGISGVKPNEVTDLVWMRYTPDETDYTTSGTFLLKVDEY